MELGPQSKGKEEDLGVKAMDTTKDRVPEETVQQGPSVPAFLRQFKPEDYMEKTSGWSFSSYKTQAQTLMKADQEKHDRDQAEFYFSHLPEKYVWDEEQKAAIEQQQAFNKEMGNAGVVDPVSRARYLKDQNWHIDGIAGFTNRKFDEKLGDLMTFSKSQTDQKADQKPAGQLLYAMKLQNKGGKVLPSEKEVQVPLAKRALKKGELDTSSYLKPSELFDGQHDAERIRLRDELQQGRSNLLKARDAEEKASAEKARKIRNGI